MVNVEQPRQQLEEPMENFPRSRRAVHWGPTEYITYEVAQEKAPIGVCSISRPIKAAFKKCCGPDSGIFRIRRQVNTMMIPLGLSLPKSTGNTTHQGDYQHGHQSLLHSMDTCF